MPRGLSLPSLVVGTSGHRPTGHRRGMAGRAADLRLLGAGRRTHAWRPAPGPAVPGRAEGSGGSGYIAGYTVLTMRSGPAAYGESREQPLQQGGGRGHVASQPERGQDGNAATHRQGGRLAAARRWSDDSRERPTLSPISPRRSSAPQPGLPGEGCGPRCRRRLRAGRGFLRAGLPLDQPRQQHPCPVSAQLSIAETAGQLADCGARMLLTAQPLATAGLAAADRSWVRQVISFGDAPTATPFASLLGMGGCSRRPPGRTTWRCSPTSAGPMVRSIQQASPISTWPLSWPS